MKKNAKKFVFLLLAVVMVVGMLPMTAWAAPVELPGSMPLVSDKESTLAPGVTLHEIVSYSGDGERVEMYVTISDLNLDTVEIYANYKDNQINAGWGFANPTEQAIAFEANHPGKQVVATTNGSYYNLTTGEPEGAFVMEGVVAIKSSNDANTLPFFAILKDGTPYIGQAGTFDSVKDNIKEAVAGHRLMVWNGERASYPPDYDDPMYKYPRNAIGVTADGKVVTLLADGYRSPFSDGTTLDELADLMIKMGCVAAVQLDGGGSASLSTKPEGSDELVLTSTPGDGGYARKVANSLVIVSTAAASDVFDHALLTAEYDYVTPNSTVGITVTGVSSTGHNADLPADTTLQVKDAAMGAIVDGKYVGAEGYTGDAVIQAVSGGQVVGETTIHVVIPNRLEFVGEKMIVKYGNTKDMVVEAHYGLNPVTIKASDFAFTWENDVALGTIEGFNFIASEDMTLTGPVTLTMSLVHNPELKDTLAVSLTDLPDAPVVVTDFEDQIPLYVDPSTLGYLREEYGIVDATTGKVHSGDYAFKTGIIHADPDTPMIQGYFHGRVAVGAPKPEGAVAMDFTKLDLTNAQKFGMWLYIPEDSVLISSAVTFVNRVSGQSVKVRLYDYGYASTEDGHRGWQYFEVDTTPYNDGNWFVEKLFLTEMCTRRPDQYAYKYGYEPAGHQSVNGYYEVYVDDITIEYLDLDVDREDPNFGDMTVKCGGVDTIVAGQTLDSNKISFSVQAIDESKLDVESAKAYIDGNAVVVSVDASGMMTTDELTLADGTHNITFVISDEHGNTDYIVRQIVVAAETDIPTVTIKSNENNGKDDELLLESLFWLDVEVDNIEDVESIEMILNLDSNSAWELEGMELAYGFSAEYSVDVEKNATITITKTGDVELSGHAVIAKLPIRVGADYAVYASGRDKTSTVWEQGAIYWLPIDVRVVGDKGLVTYADGTETMFAMESIDCDTELTDWPYVWSGQGFTHKHTAHAIADKAATCTENGYTGRTFCDVCNSVVDFGTIIPAQGHDYAMRSTGKVECINAGCGKTFNGVFVDGKLYENGEKFQGWFDETYFYVDGVKVTGINLVPAVDNADEQFYMNFDQNGILQGKVTGLFKDSADGKYSYALAGVLKTGWVMVDTDWHYFGENGDAFTGKNEFTFDQKVTYTFEENGKLVSGEWVTDDIGTRYYYGPDYYRNGFQKIGENTYYFQPENGYRLEGLQNMEDSMHTNLYWWMFTEDGVYQENYFPNGWNTFNGQLYYLTNDACARGLTMIGDDYYCFRNSGEIVYGHYYVWKTNNLAPTGWYYFDPETGIMSEPRQGLYKNADGKLYYYVDGEKNGAGLIKVGDYYYNIKADGSAVVDTTYNVWNTNGLLPAGTYQFDADGKMLNPPKMDAQGNLFTGIVTENNVLVYYINGVKDVKGSGLIKIGNDYYNIKTDGIVTVGNYYVWNTNGLMEAGLYNFDANGKLTGVAQPDPKPEEPKPDEPAKNGLVAEDGALYYYVDGVKTYAGLIKIGDDFYYINSSCKAVTGKYHVWKTNNLLPEADYTFGTDGKMITEEEPKPNEPAKNGIVTENGVMYYYVNGEKTYAGLIKIGDDVYYVNSKCQVVTGLYYVYKTNGLLEAKVYSFGEDGKMDLKEGAVKDGIVSENGKLYYYVDGELTYAGLIKIGEDIYYVNSKCQVVTGEYYVYKTNGLLDADTYNFDENGKLIKEDETVKDGIVNENGTLYYYVNGVKTYAGLIKIGEDYYYVNSQCIVVTGKYNVYKTNGLLEAKAYNFDENGKMIVDGTEVKNGIVNENGTLYYYVNGVKTYAGLIKIGEDYYYVNSKCIVVTGKYNIYKTNDLLPADTYTFGVDGKMIVK